MNPTLFMDFTVDKSNNTMHIKRQFDAPRDVVWKAWTTAEILDQWWAPKPYKCNTKTMDFKEGGYWLYYMEGPKGDIHWCRADYSSVNPQESYEATDAFCDSDGKINDIHPGSHWHNVFTDFEGDSTLVTITITYKSLEDLEKIVEMGFKEGLAMGMENLDHYISTQFKLRKENKVTNKAGVATYLNFPGNTEEVFRFYQKVFGGEFTGRGLQRFEDFSFPGQPPMDEATKKLIIHVELTILGGHRLMATDAPESMGFKVNAGNNMHIHLEPDSKEEADRLFNELSAGGEVEMGMKDMFWGAYFGSFQDKYGINWMINYQPV
ncbi:SRPBCC domain-containing protein [Marinoscillum luteum]|uniref:SRPBCC domain-containing protein n=1 Tax=Marinoscillum luteum TaxID=861051 RepID=A0ABW7N7V1_9BACT